MKQSKQLKTEEKTFLLLCCQCDRDMLTGKADMTLQDFERIIYLTVALGYVEYTFALSEKYFAFTIKLSEQIDRENEFLRKCAADYLDEQIDKQYQKWINDFISNMTEDKQSYYHRKLENP